MTSHTERYGCSGRVNVYTCKDGKVLNRHSQTENLQSIKQFLRSVFLPQGYPLSVSEDYLEYQLWDTLQAFSSSITGALATQAVLKGVGVGDSNATVMAATITWLLKDGTGMVGRILFAWMKGSSLDSDCKKWRMYADILNDMAIMLDILSPFFMSFFTLVVCISGVMRSIVGVAGGATRAAITQHQARRNNMADVAAKDGSQETLVNLAGLLVSLLIIPLLTGHTFITWCLFIIFTMVHLYANYRAVTCIVMETLNQSRFSLVVADYVTKGYCPQVKEVNEREPVIFGTSNSFSINLGCSYNRLLPSDKNIGMGVASPQHKNESYILNVDSKKREVNICLKSDTEASHQLKACYQAELIKLSLHPPPHNVFQPHFKSLEGLKDMMEHQSKSDIKDVINATHAVVMDTWTSFRLSLMRAGWNIDHVMLNADEWRLQTI